MPGLTKLFCTPCNVTDKLAPTSSLAPTIAGVGNERLMTYRCLVQIVLHSCVIVESFPHIHKGHVDAGAPIV